MALPVHFASGKLLRNPSRDGTMLVLVGVVPYNRLGQSGEQVPGTLDRSVQSTENRILTKLPGQHMSLTTNDYQ
jgi:hypothetical protein